MGDDRLMLLVLVVLLEIVRKPFGVFMSLMILPPGENIKGDVDMGVGDGGRKY